LIIGLGLIIIGVSVIYNTLKYKKNISLIKKELNLNNKINSGLFLMTLTTLLSLLANIILVSYSLALLIRVLESSP
jgi:hypothetical protein